MSLYDNEEFQAIKTLDGQMKQFLRRETVPSYAELLQKGHLSSSGKSDRTKQLQEVLEDIVTHDGTVPVNVLRSSDGFRQHVIGQLQEIGGHLQALVEDGPLRAFTLDDD